MSSHDESETCRTCHVLHGDGPAHICNPYAARWPEGPTDAEVKRGLNQLMSKMADMATKLSAENLELTLARAAADKRAEKAEAEVKRLTARWERLERMLKARPAREQFYENILDDLEEFECEEAK